VQTFVPVPSMVKSMRCLDTRRLGKQRVEGIQILITTLGMSPKDGWANHPATLMWEDCAPALALYTLAACTEWKRRGYADGISVGLRALFGAVDPDVALGSPLYSVQRLGWYAKTEGPFALLPWDDLSPWWWGDDRVHSSHRSNLLRKDPKHYGQFGWKDDPAKEYYWPT